MDIFKEIVKECTYKTSRSGGAGGQHVNKVETKVKLRWSIRNSKLFSSKQKELLLLKLKPYIDSEAVLSLTVQKTRSQLKNKKLAQEKLSVLIQNALKKTKKRRTTSLPKGIKEKRLKVKRMQSENKQYRKKVKW